MPTFQKLNRKSSARTQIDIKGARDGILLLPNNSYRCVLSVSALNFELKSEEEQDAILETYEGFLNSVGCPLQVLIRIREIDMDNYLGDLEERIAVELEPIYRTQLKNYDAFIRSLITTNKILTRHFYVIVSYDAGSRTEFDAVKEQLGLRVDIVRKGLARLGMHSRELGSLEILDLFYSFYNPEQAKLQPLTERALAILHSGYIQKGEIE